jgi:hypothetical protein
MAAFEAGESGFLSFLGRRNAGVRLARPNPTGIIRHRFSEGYRPNCFGSWKEYMEIYKVS